MSTLTDEIEELVVLAKRAEMSDDEWLHRAIEPIRRDPRAVVEAAAPLVFDPDPDRREVGADLIGRAAELDESLRSRVLLLLRSMLAEETEAGPLSTAVAKLANLDDETSHDRVIELASHRDAVVRFAVAAGLPRVGYDTAALLALLDLMNDPDDDVRDWATFGVGTQGDYDDERIREALLAQVDHPHRDVRFEAITGLCRRQDERVRPALESELADPDHSDDYDRALEFLDTGSEVPEDGWESTLP